MRSLARMGLGMLLVGVLGAAGCATWTPEQRASWDNVVLGLQQLGAASEAARHESDHRQMEYNLAAIRLQQAMPPIVPFPFGR